MTMSHNIRREVRRGGREQWINHQSLEPMVVAEIETGKGREKRGRNRADLS